MRHRPPVRTTTRLLPAVLLLGILASVVWAQVAEAKKPGGSSSPRITAFSPTGGPVGTTVSFTGSGFSSTRAVKFNGLSAPFAITSDTQLSAKVPSGATSGPITVTTSGGSASTTTFTVQQSPPPPPPSPTISSFSPTSAAPGTTVTISGSNLTGATNVAFNGTAASYTVNSGSQITATVPASATSGPVSTTTGAGTATSSTSFTVSQPATPSSAPSGPITITTGGTYTGNWTATSSTPAVRISTTQPVTITNSTIQGSGGTTLVSADGGSNVTITHTTFNGANGRAFYSSGIKSLTFSNNSITGTTGIRFDGAASAATISITRNEVSNIQPAAYATEFVQLANVTTAQIDISWNQVINVFGQSGVEDNISLYGSSNAQVHDNYIQGAYPLSATAGFSGSGIMIESSSHDDKIYSNQIVETTNAGIGIADGWNNSVYNNRLIFDGRLDDGTPLTAANVGLYVWNMAADPAWSNNQAYGNTSGWINAAGAWNDAWLPDCSGSCSNSGWPTTINHAAETGEYQVWLSKLSAGSISIGA